MANKKVGIPTAILLSIQDYEDLEDLIETALEHLWKGCNHPQRRRNLGSRQHKDPLSDTPDEPIDLDDYELF